MILSPTFVLPLAALLWAGHMTPGHAQTANSLDQRTERREVRPGCSILIRPGAPPIPSARIFSGGSCPDGLLDGIVKFEEKSDTGSIYRALIAYRAGKWIGGNLGWADQVERGYELHDFTTRYFDENGNFVATKSGLCPGKDANERANSNSACKEVARVFGVNAFDGSGANRNQGPPPPRDDPKSPGGFYRP